MDNNKPYHKIHGDKIRPTILVYDILVRCQTTDVYGVVKQPLHTC